MSSRLASRSVGLSLLLCWLVACGSEERAPAVQLGVREQAAWSNGDFENDTIGTQPPSGWAVQTYQNFGITDLRPAAQTLASLNLQAGGVAATPVIGGALESQTDPDLGAGASLRFPKYGIRAARVNYLNTTNSYRGNNHNTNAMTQTMTVTLGDVDVTDNKVHVRFAVAPVLESGGHDYDQQPYYFVVLENVSKGSTLYTDFNSSAQPGVPWKNVGNFYYTDWQLVDVAPGNAALSVGDQVRLTVIAAGCYATQHAGRVYLDGVGSGPPGLYAWGTGPQSANAGSDITYTITYKNNGATTANNTVITFATPPNTSFRSLSLPNVCTGPALGGTGTITCNLGAQVPGTVGSFNISVNVNAGATGSITAGTYQISATGVSPLVGPKIITAISAGTTYADLDVTQSNGVAALNWGSATSYTIRVANNGPAAASSVTVADIMPAQLSAVTWTCSTVGGGSCPSSGSGDINHVISLPAGALATYVVNATVSAGVGTGTLRNTVTASVAGGVADPNAGNNTAVDVDDIGTTRTITLTKTGATGGTIASTPATIHCGTACASASGTYLSGSSVTLTAAPVPYATFVGWGGACAAAGTATTCTLVMSADRVVSATFTPPPTVSVSSGSGQNTTLSAAFAQPLSAIVRNSAGTPQAGVTVSFYVPASGPSASLSALTAVSNAQGLASVTPTANALSGSYNVTAMISGSVSVAAFALINHGPATSIGFYSGTPQTALPGAAFAAPLVAIVRDASNTPVSGATVTFSAPAGGATAALTTSVVTDAQGLAASAASASNAAGSYTVSATIAGVATAASFALVNGPCNGNSGSASSAACASAAPYCANDGSCSAQCQRDSDCGSGNWCNAGACVVKLANGVALPTVPSHSPTLNGVCGSSGSPAALAVCASGACDVTTNTCGIGLTHGTCSGDAQCTSGVCVSVGTNAGSCRICRDDAQCSGSTPACDTGTNVCVTCTATNTSRCSGVVPLCDVDAHSCVACNGNDGSAASHACGAAAPYCADAGSCSAQCQRDGDCGAGNWCSAGSCVPRLPNGTPIPVVAGHAPLLDGNCSAPVGSAICVSNVCDVASDRCGFDLTHGTCASDLQCSAGVCIAAGTNLGTCQACRDAGQCAGATAVCDAASNQCVACTAADISHCTGATPVCDSGAHSCVGCNGNHGSAASHACALAAPYCAADGACSSQCQRDADCGAASWCNAGACAAKLPNTVGIPSVVDHLPALVGVCSPAVALSVCESGACDTLSNRCGIDLGHGTCAADAQCNDGVCVSAGANAGTCQGCRTDAQCGAQVCDTTQNACVQCSAENASLCADVTPVCDVSSHSCVACNGNEGTAASNACPASARFCTEDGSCSATCVSDANCGSGYFCNAGSCAPQLDNGLAIPVVPGHSPTLDGHCTVAAATAVCNSGVCDPGTDQCGLELDSPGCSSDVQCNAGVCVSVGPNTGRCQLCKADAQCSGATPVCETSSNVCVACTSDQTDACSGATPVCDNRYHCVACDGDHGGAEALRCPAASEPYCAGDGGCGRCADNSSCGSGHAGPLCSVVSGACGDACSVDADCPLGFCENPSAQPSSGVCRSRLDNGQPIPSAAPFSSTCSAPTALRVCSSGRCDEDDALCGLPNGRDCVAASECRSQLCNDDGKCGARNGEPCTAADTCRSGICNADGRCGLTNGETCSTAGACRSSSCIGVDRKCGELNGTPCAEAAQCRSGVCDPDGHCGRPLAGSCTRVEMCRAASCIDGSCVNVCQNDGQCPALNFCQSGRCVPSLPNDAACVRDTQCSQNVCASDGKCGSLNDVSCADPASCRSGACVRGSCNATCARDEECLDGSYCDQAGCRPARSPDAACTREAQCSAGVCADDGKCAASTGDLCMLGSQCRSGICGPGQRCSLRCTADPECTVGFYCAAGACVPQLKNGERPESGCTRSAQCLSGVCAADGACGSLNEAPCGVDAVCRSAVCNGGDARCGRLNGQGPCAVEDPFPVCRSEACDDAVCGLTLGHGPCNDAKQCLSAICDESSQTCVGCSDDSKCRDDQYCAEGRCVERGANGERCERREQCASGVCADDGRCGAVDGSECDVAAACRSAACAAGLCVSDGPDGGIPDAGAGGGQRGGLAGGAGCSVATASSARSQAGLASVMLLVGFSLLTRRRRERKELRSRHTRDCAGGANGPT